MTTQNFQAFLSKTGSVGVPFLILIFFTGGCQIWRHTGVSSSATLASRQYVRQAVDSLQTNNRTDASTKLELAVKANPENYEARQMLADLLWEAGDRENAILQMQRAAQIDDASAEIHIKLAWMYYETQEYPLSQKYLSRGLKLNSTLADGWVLQGKLHEQNRNIEKAIAAYHQAIFFDPEEDKAPLYLADCYLNNSQPQRALETIQVALSKCPPGKESSEILYREGLAMTRLKRYDDAVRVLTLASKNQADAPNIQAALADVRNLTSHGVTAEITPQYGAQVEPEKVP